MKNKTEVTSGYVYTYPPYDKDMKQFALSSALQAIKNNGGELWTEDYSKKLTIREVAQLFYEWLTKPDQVLNGQ